MAEVFHPGTLPIWEPSDSEYFNARKNGCYLFRKTFRAESRVESAEWRIFADTRYRAYVDGRLVGWGPSRSDHRLAQYDAYNLDLDAGEHVLAVFAMHYGYSTGANTSIHQMLIAELSGKDSTGRVLLVGTDPTWKAHPAHWLQRTNCRVSGTLGPIEICDERERIDGWEAMGFDDTTWPTAATLYGSTESLPWYSFEARDIPFLRSRYVRAAGISHVGTSAGNPCENADLGRNLPDVTWSPTHATKFPVTADGSAATVVNVSWHEILCGFLQLQIIGEAGTIVDVYYAEALDGKRVAAFGASLRRVCDRFILKEGLNELEVVFGWKAFAHVQLWIYGKAVFTGADVRAIEYPLPDDPGYDTGDATANKLFANCYRTLRLCAQDGLLDSPSREQQQWMGDGERQASALFTLYRETGLWKRLLRQIGQSIDWSGCLLPRYPGRHEHTAPIPAFMLSWIFSHDEYVRRTGDESLLQAWWPQMVAVMRWFTRFENAAGQLENVPYWSFIDWGETPGGPALDVTRGGIVTALNALYLGARKCMAHCAERLGDAEGRHFYSGGQEERQARLRALTWDAGCGAFVDCVLDGRRSMVISEPTNLLMLAYSGVGADSSRSVLDCVFLRPCAPVVRMSPFFHQLFGRVLAGAGQARFAFDTMVSRLAPSLETGATTIWERYKLFHSPPGQRESYISSASHAWGAMLPSFFVEEVLGLRCEDLSGLQFSIRPLAGEFPEASIDFPTAAGLATISWKVGPESFQLSYEIPQGSKVYLGNYPEGLRGAGSLVLPKLPAGKYSKS